MSVFLYGVVRSDHCLPEPPPRGVGDPPAVVRLVRCGPVAAAVSTIPRGERHVVDADPVRDRQLAVLCRLLDDGPVLPLPPNMIASSDAAVRADVLDPAAYQLRHRLDALEGTVEVHVDADEDETDAIRAVIAADPVLAAARSQPHPHPQAGPDGGPPVRPKDPRHAHPDDQPFARPGAWPGSRPGAWPGARPATRPDGWPGPPPEAPDPRALGERVADGVILRRVRQSRSLLEALRPHAVADLRRGPMGGPTDPVLCWAFLVRRAGDPLRRDLGHFDAAVDRIRREHPELRIHYTGPLPAYHFFDLVAPIPIG